MSTVHERLYNLTLRLSEESRMVQFPNSDEVKLVSEYKHYLAHIHLNTLSSISKCMGKDKERFIIVTNNVPSWFGCVSSENERKMYWELIHSVPLEEDLSHHIIGLHLDALFTTLNLTSIYPNILLSAKALRARSILGETILNFKRRPFYKIHSLSVQIDSIFTNLLSQYEKQYLPSDSNTGAYAPYNSNTSVFAYLVKLWKWESNNIALDMVINSLSTFNTIFETIPIRRQGEYH